MNHKKDRSELRRLQDTVKTLQAQPRLDGLTAQQHRFHQNLLHLPHRYTVSLNALPIAAGHVTFIRQVTFNGKIRLLGQTFKIGKRLRGEYVKVVLDTRRGRLIAYRNGRMFKRWPYKSVNK